MGDSINSAIRFGMTSVGLTLAASSFSGAEDVKGSKPNIIFILADDLGYNELGCYGQTKIKTPNIDKIAAEGMMFTSHYSGSTVCAPSRCTLMTGLHTGHTHVRGNKGRPIVRTAHLLQLHAGLIAGGLAVCVEIGLSQVPSGFCLGRTRRYPGCQRRSHDKRNSRQRVFGKSEYAQHDATPLNEYTLTHLNVVEIRRILAKVVSIAVDRFNDPAIDEQKKGGP